MKLVLVAIIIISLCVLLLSLKIILKKGGRFPSTHVGDSKEMRKRGIGCHTSQHWEAQGKHNLEERLEAKKKAGLL